MTQGVSERLTFTLHELVAEIDAAADQTLRSRYGVSFGVFEFLAVLDDVQPADMTTLAHCLGVTKAAISKRVPALVEQGWIRARQTPGGGRSIHLSLTERGTELVRTAGDELETELHARLDGATAGTEAIDIAALNRQLRALTDLFRRQHSDASPEPSTDQPSVPREY